MLNCTQQRRAPSDGPNAPGSKLPSPAPAHQLGSISALVIQASNRLLGAPACARWAGAAGEAGGCGCLGTPRSLLPAQRLPGEQELFKSPSHCARAGAAATSSRATAARRSLGAFICTQVCCSTRERRPGSAPERARLKNSGSKGELLLWDGTSAVPPGLPLTRPRLAPALRAALPCKSAAYKWLAVPRYSSIALLLYVQQEEGQCRACMQVGPCMCLLSRSAASGRCMLAAPHRLCSHC